MYKRGVLICIFLAAAVISPRTGAPSGSQPLRPAPWPMPSQSIEQGTLDLRVSAGSDDAEETPSGRMALDSSDIELVYDNYLESGNQTVGFRFNAVNIPPGAAVLSAYVQFQVDETGSEATTLMIQGEDSDSSATFLTTARNISTRPRTMASASWSPAAWTVVGAAGAEQRTPNLAAVIQEVVDRSGWASGNSLAIIVIGSGRRIAESYEGTRTGAALLHVEYASTVANRTPSATIIAPLNGAIYTIGTSIGFSGTASDAEDGDLTSQLTWTSNINGVIGTGGSFSRSDLAAGVHTITAAVTDSGGRTDEARILMTVSATGPTLTRGPYLQLGTPDSIVIRWRTSYATEARVCYGTDPASLTMTADNFELTSNHEVRLTGLQPSTRYYYSIGTTGLVLRSGAEYSFVTAPPAGSSKKSRIWVVSDIHGTLSSQRQVRDAYAAYTGSVPTDLWLILGDDSSTGTDSSYQTYLFNEYQAMLRTSVVWSTFGNRDGGLSTTGTGAYYDMWTFPKNGEAGGMPSNTEAYYSFDYANIHFICLNSIDVSLSTTGSMLTWLRSDLAANQRPWVVAFLHDPAYSRGVYDSDSDSTMTVVRTNVLPILESYGVDLVLTGHNHSYERSYLLDGHYGKSTTLTSSMILDGGDGKVEGGGAYLKATYGMAPHQGAVYVSASTSSTYCTPCSLNHPANFYSTNTMGSAIIDVDGDRLDLTFLDRNRAVRDHFTIIKGGAAPPNTAPTVAISSPASGSSFAQGTAVMFGGSAADTEDGDLSASLTWTSNRDGVIGTGAAFATSSLTLGTHIVTSSAADSGGLTGQAEVSVTIISSNSPPTVTISSPANGSSFTEGATVAFAGSAADAEDGDLSPALVWTSSRDGGIGAGASFTKSDLSVGTHTITASVTDSGGAGQSSQRTVVITRVGGEPDVLDVRIAAGADDAEESARGYVSLTSNDLELVLDSDLQTVGLRFAGVNVPPGSTILSAYLQFQADETGSEATSLAIRGQAADQASAFLSTVGNVSSRPRTAAAVSWSPAPWSAIGEAGLNQRTPDLAAVIQEIVDRPGWASGNPLVIIMTGTGKRTAESFEGTSTGAALLHLEYTTGTVNRAPSVAIVSPANGTGFQAGDPVGFSGTASDLEDGDLTAQLTWVSNLDGTIGTGGSFSRSNLSLGAHTITASVADSGGAGQSAQTSIVIYESGVPATQEIRIAAGPDDAEEKAAGYISLDSNDLELVLDADLQTIGLRFSGVNIPRGASILKTYVQFQADETGSGDVALLLQGEAADQSGAFSTLSRNISSRPRTSAAVSWSPPAWNLVGEAGSNQRTPDLAAVIQEIVNRTGWAAGHSLAIIVTGTGKRVAESYEGGAALAPLLHIEYTTAPAPAPAGSRAD